MEGKEDEGFALPLSQTSASSSTSSSSSSSSSSSTEQDRETEIINSKNFIDDNALTAAAAKLKIISKADLQTRIPSILGVFAGSQYLNFLSIVLPIVSAGGNPSIDQL